jgi:acyl-coenzyme A thioesterase PaaI-like protein
MTQHPSIAPRHAEMRALADAVRRLIELTVTNEAPAEETAEFAAELHALADRLAKHVPDSVAARYQFTKAPNASDHDKMPYDVVIGYYNPLALPVEIEVDAPRAIGRATFTTAYEGPPGCVHGAVIAGAFDMVLNAANQIAGAAGPTAKLAIRYRRPTLLHEPLTFEAEVVNVSGRRTTTIGRIVQDGLVTVEAEGLFIALDHAQIASMGDRMRG